MRFMRYRRYKYWLMSVLAVLIVSFGLLLAGCSSSGAADMAQMARSEAYEPEVTYGESMAMEENIAAMEAPAAFADGQSMPLENFLAQAAQAQETRIIIYSGDISLVVQDTEAAVDAITQLADAQSGYVSGSNVYESGEALRGSITIRVPADRYQATMAALRELALRVERESSTTQDVTEEFTDLEARRKNLEATETALQQLLDQRQRTGSTDDILQVYRELSSVRGQIEQIEGRLRYLANQAALSTIDIDLTPDALSQPISVGGWQPQGAARDALQSLIWTLQELTDLAIWVVVFVLPLGLIAFLPLMGVVLILRGWSNRRRRRKAAKAAQEEPPKE